MPEEADHRGYNVNTLHTPLHASLQKVWSHSQKRANFRSLTADQADRLAHCRNKTDRLNVAMHHVKQVALDAYAKGKTEPLHLSHLNLQQLGMLEELVYDDYLALKKEFDSKFPSEKPAHIFLHYRNLYRALCDHRHDLLRFLNTAWHDPAVRTYIRKVIKEIKHQECELDVFFNCEFEKLGEMLTVACPQLLAAMGEELDLIKAISKIHKIGTLNKVYFFKRLHRILKNISYV